MDTKPTRFNLILLKDKNRIFVNILSILKARRLALIKELLTDIKPYLKTQKEIKNLLRSALVNYKISKSIDDRAYIQSLKYLNRREFPILLINKNIYGLKYKEVKIYENVLLRYEERRHNPSFNSLNLEVFEKKTEEVIDEAIKLSNFESKIKVITDEIMKLNKKIRVLEERMIPKTKKMIKEISIFLGERERENYFRLKIFKNKKTLPLNSRV